MDDAIIGVAENKANGEYLIVYSKTKVIKILMNRDEMTYDDAVEYFNFNIESAYVGEKTPLWVDDELFTDYE